MGSFFVVQVHTGYEIEAKEMLKVVLNKTNNTNVKAIYAMETFTEVVKNNDDFLNLSNFDLDEESISEHLHVRRIQAGLTNLRNACEGLKSHNGEDSLTLLQSYQENIRSLSKQLREVRKNSKKISSLLNGYILIELTNDVYTLPNDLWHLIKSVPKIVGFPSKNNVPQEEIEYFFQKVDITPQVELEFDEILAYEEIEMIQSELLDEANESSVSESGIKLIDEMDELNQSLESEINEIIEDSNIHKDNKSVSPIGRTLVSIKAYVQRKREKVKMSMPLFRLLYPDHPKINNMENALSRTNFLKRLKSFVNSFNDSEVLLE